MFLQRSSCILCAQHISKIKYNLKTTYSETSNVLLIKFVEKLYKNIFLMHCNICSPCYALLNELDYVQAKEKELYTKLKDYISKVEDSPKLDSKKKEKDITEEIPVFSELTNDDTEINEDPFSDIKDIKIEDIDIDLKKLPIKIKRVTSSKPLSKDSVFEIDQNSKPSSKEVSDNQEAFEKIQSSIQMDLSKHVQEYMTKYKPARDVLCEICGQSFKTKMGFENHVKKHGDAEDDLKILVMNKKDEFWPCNICGKIFNQKVALSRHTLIHTGETRYQCEECGKKFIHHSSFNMHRKIHRGQRNFLCQDCNKGFLTRSHLKRHLRAAHSGEKEYSCKFCGKEFAENYNMVAHIKVVHRLQETEGDLLYEGDVQDNGEVEGEVTVEGDGEIEVSEVHVFYEI